MVSLSSIGLLCCTIVVGSPQLSPPSLERLTSTAEIAASPFLTPLRASAIWYAVPSGEIAAHGSLARSYTPPEQTENRGDETVHVTPPSMEAAAIKPLAAPSDQ